MCADEVAERTQCVERKPRDFHYGQRRSAGLGHPRRQQKTTSVRPFDYEVDQIRVDYAPNDSDPSSDERMMRVSDDDFEEVFLRTMSRTRMRWARQT